MVLPATSVACGAWLWRSTGSRRGAGDTAPFVLAVAIFVIAFLGLAYSLYPYIVIDRLTIWEAAAHPTGLKALMIGAGIVLPFIVAYTILAYRIFRGKANAKLYD